MRKMANVAFMLGLLTALGTPAMAQGLAPKAEVFGGYSYLRESVAGSGFNFNGGSGSLAVNPTNWLGIVGDVGGYHLNESGLGVTLITFMAGPRISFRTGGRMTPFAQALFGGAHVNASFSGSSGSDNAFATALGGGLDYNVGTHIAIRLIQAEYLLTKFNDGLNNRQNNARISAGIVFRFGGR
jgi:opacity protein-like surface antigen